MPVALLADIHANRHALEACLADARARGADGFAVLGDLVGYGAEPGAVVDAVMALAAQGAPVIQGNHDEMAVHPPPPGESLGAATARWTHEQLSAAQRDFLRGLPLHRALGPLRLVHASAHAPPRWLYVQDAGAAQRCADAALELGDEPHVAVGHVHEQMLYYPSTGHAYMAFKPTPGVAIPLPRHRRAVATIGSVGQPRDGDNRAMYAIYDEQRRQLTFHRVDYDHAGAAAAIRRAGLPAMFADRLGVGQ